MDTALIALRVYEMFIAPYDMDAPWDPRGVPGTYRFLNRAWNLVQEFVDKNPNDSLGANEKTAQELLRLTHLTIKKVLATLKMRSLIQPWLR